MTRARVFKGTWSEEPKELTAGDPEADPPTNPTFRQELLLTPAEEVVTVAVDFPDVAEEELTKTAPQAVFTWSFAVNEEGPSFDLLASNYPVSLSDEGFSAGTTHAMTFLKAPFVKTADYVPPSDE